LIGPLQCAAVADVRVNFLDHPYDVAVEPGLLSRVGEALRAMSRSPKVAVVTESTVAPLHLPALRVSLRDAGFEVITATFPAGENHKTVATTSSIYDALLPAKLDRSTPVLALGGGVVGDMAGFAAATMLRGVPLVQVPSTLLSMVDASVGGKTGVNHASGKNLIGAFHQPIAVFIDPRVLKTLPPRELRGGLAECIKHDIIRDADGFARLEQSIDRAVALDMEFLTDLIAHNVAIKAKVVAADPFEKGERAHLNFGHTFGHAIETVSKYEYSHGECVALGMVAASYAAVRLGMLATGDRERIIQVIARAGLPTGGMKLDPAAVVEAMGFDKKVAAGKLRFVLPDRIGHVVIRDDVPNEVVREAVDSLRG
jgi:3-dehydroquinate synthase